MASALLGRKIGMTRYFTEEGANIPVTVIQAGPCVVTQIKTDETDGYAAVQVAYEDVAPRRSTMPVIGHDHTAGTSPKRFHREYRTDDVTVELGETITVDCFADVKFVDISGRSKGKGFQGGMKRHHFAGLEASHGVKRRHRCVGSIGGHSSNLGTGPKLKKGKRMPGHMGDVNVTVRSLPVVAIDTDRNLILVMGTVPGPNNACVFVRPAVRLNRRKTTAQGKK
jgi:large subunit ribosomal protein L3